MKNPFRKRVLTEISFIVGAVLVFAAAIFYFGANISKTSEAIVAKSRELQANLNALTDLVRLRSEFQTIGPYINTLNQLIPTRDGLFSFSSYMKSLAARGGLTSDLKFGEEAVVSGEFKTIRFSLTLQGTYPDISRYVADVEAAPYLINIDNFSSIGQLERHTATIDGSVLFKDSPLSQE